MNRRWPLIGSPLVAILSVSPPAIAAEITDVADAADTIRIGSYERSDAFDLYVDIGYELSAENGKITREPIDRPGLAEGCLAANARACAPVDELRWKRTTSSVRVRGQIGISEDLALTLGWQYVVDESLAFRYARGVGPDNSTVDGTTFGTLFRHDFRAKHRGAGALDLGLRFAPLSDERDESKPSWVLAVNWSAPWTAERYNPTVRANDRNPGPVGDGVHRLTFTTALSKRIGSFGLIGIDPNLARRGYLDPYVELSYVLPIPQRGRALADLVQSDANRFGRRPSHEGRFNAGFEIVPFEDLKSGRKVAVDLGLRSAYFSEGRNYTLLTDALGEVTYSDPYLYMGGLLGLYAQASRFIRLKVGVAVGHDTEHFLTNEDVGIDRNGDGQILRPDDDPNLQKDDINPYFCGNRDTDLCAPVANGGGGQLPYDQVGFRFKDEEHVIVDVFASLMFTF